MSEIIKQALREMTASFAAFRDNSNDRMDAIENHVAMSDAPGGGTFRGGPRSEFAGGLGEFALCVAAAAIGNSGIDPRLQKIQAAASGMNEGVPSEGGFLVEKQLMEPLLQGIFETGQLAKLCLSIPITGNNNGLKLPMVDETSRVNGSRFGGVRSYWAADAASVTATIPKVRMMELTLHKLFATSYATDELMADVPALGKFLNFAFNEEMSFKIDDG
ncbi:MAG: phage major capsid protein, partial [Holophagae bacterium]|nr:phage major capsid protein [Holophagae bacterium]